MRVGFIVNSRVPSLESLQKRGMMPYHLLTGWDDRGSPMSLMRFKWLAEELGKTKRAKYELFKPWVRYDAVVFLKSMGSHCAAAAESLKEKGTKVVFDANVDYYSPAPNNAALQAMIPSPEQRHDAIQMTRLADGVMASSRRLADICSEYSETPAKWIPDNVKLDLIPELKRQEPFRKHRLQLWWSGVSQKSFEFLAIEETLRKFHDQVHLHLVTNSMFLTKDWDKTLKGNFKDLMRQVPHTIHEFDTVEALLKLYRRGGVVVSPRYLDVPYNLSHSEWKLTLGMACGLPGLCSPVPSYEEVAKRAGKQAIRVCHSTEEWNQAFQDLMDHRWEVQAGSKEAIELVRAHYSTEKIAGEHADFIESLL